MTKDKIIIEIDDREPDCQLLSDIENLNLEFTRKRLEVGDFKYKDLVIERKTIDDFCSSILDGRFERQLTGNKPNVIIVIGDIDERKVAIHKNCILGKLVSIVFKHDVHILQVKTEEEFLWCLRNFCEKHDNLSKEKEENGK